MGQDICIRKDEKPLGYDWECGHEELYVRVNMYYNGSLYVGLWQKQKETEQAAAMKALLDQGYSQDAVSEAFQCFPSTVRRRVRKLTERKETNDRSEIDCRNI